jgi:hypothetical protein
MSTTRSIPRFARCAPFLLLGAALLGPSSLARADEPSPRDAIPFEPTALAADVAGLETGDLDESAYDIPGQLIVDARDDLDAGAITALARDFGLHFTPTALEAETRGELAQVSPSRLRELMERLSRDSRVELVEPLARVRAFYTPNDPLLKSSGTWSASARSARGISPPGAASPWPWSTPASPARPTGPS